MRFPLPSHDSLAYITPGVVFNNFPSAIVDEVIEARPYSRPAILRAITGIESETNKTSDPIIGLKIAIRKKSKYDATMRLSGDRPPKLVSRDAHSLRQIEQPVVNATLAGGPGDYPFN